MDVLVTGRVDDSGDWALARKVGRVPHGPGADGDVGAASDGSQVIVRPTSPTGDAQLVDVIVIGRVDNSGVSSMSV